MLKFLPVCLLLSSCVDWKNNFSFNPANEEIPSTPTTISMLAPATSFGLSLTPKILVTGVNAGNTVEIFSKLL